MLYEQLAQDVRFQEGMKGCMNCGTCTAICPAAEFYDSAASKRKSSLTAFSLN